MNYEEEDIDDFDDLEDSESIETVRIYGKERDKFLSLLAKVLNVV